MCCYGTYNQPVGTWSDDTSLTLCLADSLIIGLDYEDTIKNRGIDGERQMSEAIDTADLELLQAILTGYIRQERFCDGLWSSAVEDKVFLKILKRLQQL